MPNIGRPSRSCYRCRHRRVKCDLTQPQCQNCLRLGQPCPGYRKESELLFRNENPKSYTENVSKDRRKANTDAVLPVRNVPLPVFKMGNNDTTGKLAHHDAATYDFRSISPSRSLPESWDEHAIPFVISLFSAPMSGGRFYGFMDFFPEMIAKAPDDSTLVLCSKAVAFIFFNNRFTVAEGTDKRVAAYGKALRATNAALNDSVCGMRDETPVSIWLLSVYENFCGGTMSPRVPAPPVFFMHIQGLITLLRTRTRPQFLSGEGRRFFWMVMCVVEALSLAAAMECPREIFKWLENNIADFVPGELDMHRALVHGYHASVICAKMRLVADSETLPESQSIMDLIEEARKLGRENEANLTQDPASKRLPIRQAHLHNFHRAVRIHLQYSILELIRSSVIMKDATITAQFIERQERLSISTVQNLAQSVLSTIPCILGTKASTPSAMSQDEEDIERSRCWFDGMRLLWPLRVLGSRKVISQEQRTVVEDTLQRLNSELYIRAAVVPYIIPVRRQLEPLEKVKLPKKRKGCKTCRRRKVKCDEDRPCCQRCRASQLDCEGYDEISEYNDRAHNVVPIQPNSNIEQGFIPRLYESDTTLADPVKHDWNA